MKIRRLGLGGLALSLGMGFWACSSDDSSGTGNAGGSSSSGGSSGSTGTSGSGGGQNNAGDQSSAGGASGSSSGGGGSSAAGSSGSGGVSTDASTKSDATLSPDGAGGGGGGGAFTLTSMAYTEGMTIPPVHTCADANTSPQLGWSGAPATTKSFALVFTDKDNNGGFIHWVLWDIPPTTISLMAALPAGMPAGTKGSSIAGATGGYGGPCPNGNLHHYIFELYPLDVATLPNAMTNGDRPALVTNIKGHQLVAPASLTGTSNAKRP
jgi:Raf kinase inhibitor-like YbhB/YbcL family protein